MNIGIAAITSILLTIASTVLRGGVFLGSLLIIYLRGHLVTGTPTFDIPDTTIQSILARAEANYDVPFDNDQWQLERAKIDAGETERPPLDAQSVPQTASPRQSE